MKALNRHRQKHRRAIFSPNSTSSTVRASHFSSSTSSLDTAERLERNEKALAEILEDTVTGSEVSSLSEAEASEIEEFIEPLLLPIANTDEDGKETVVIDDENRNKNNK